jgi:hypothetical protein
VELKRRSRTIPRTSIWVCLVDVGVVLDGSEEPIGTTDQQTN